VIQAAGMLASGVSTVDVAAELGVDRWTVRKWRERPEFQREYQRIVAAITEENVAQAVTGLRRLAPKAIKRMDEGMDADTEKGDTDHTIRLRAAGMALDRIPELSRHQTVEVGGELALLIAETDERSDGASD
jgi:hypothetical protein